MKKSITILLIAVYICQSLYAEEIKFRKPVKMGEFANSSVTAICEDKLGRMWFGTRSGLFMYNAYDLTPFYHQYNKNSLSSNLIHSLVYDDNNIWVGTSHGIDKISLVDLSVERYTLPLNKESDSDVIKISVCNEELWCWTRTSMFKYNISENKFRNITVEKDLPKIKITGVLKRNNSEYIISSDSKGLFYFYPKTNRLLEFPEKSLQKYRIVGLLFDTDKNILLATRNNGLFKLDRDMELNRQIYKGLSDKIFSINKFNQKLIVTTDGDGVAIINNNGEVEKFNTSNGKLTGDIVFKTFLDSRGMLWFGLIDGGVVYLDNYYSGFENYMNTSFIIGSLKRFNILDILFIRSNTYLVSVDGKGLYELNVKTGKKRHISNIKQKHIKRLLKDSDGNIWGGTYHEGIIKLNSNYSLVNHIDNLNSDKSGKRFDSVWSLTEDDSGNILLGTLTGGLFIYDKKSNSIVRFTDKIKKGSFNENSVTALYREKNNNIWIGTKHGAYLYYKKRNTIVSFKDICSEGFVSERTIRQFYRDSKERMWIATEDGLILFKNGKSKLLSKSQGLSGNRIQSVIEDVLGNIWISTSYGLNLFLEDGTIRRFLKDDGIPSNIFNTNGGRVITPDGRIALNTIDGLTFFHPSDISKNRIEPPVTFSKLWINGKLTSRVSDKNISVTNELELTYNQRNISIEFAAQNYHLSSKNLYSYKLEGFDKGWTNPSKERRVTYTNLEPGEYIFKVIASNNDGVWNDKGKSLVICVNPPWWDSWWANLTYLLLLILFIFLYRAYTVKGERLKHEIVAKETESKRMEEIQNIKSKFFTNISHELRTPLSLIVAPVKSLIERNDDLSDNERTGIYHTIQKNCERLVTLVNKLLDYRKIESGVLKPKVENIDLRNLIENVLSRYDNLAKSGKVAIKTDFQTDEFIWADKVMMENVLSNLISNSINHSGKEITQISIGISKEIHEIVLTIQDNGKGIPEELVDNIFERFFQVENHGKGSGIGLAYVKEILELHRATINIDKEYISGAKFILRFKEGSDHFDLDSIKSSEIAEINDDAVDLPVDNDDSQQKPKLMIVEDSEELLNYLSFEFKDKYKIKSATNGKEAMKIVESFYPDIIISDVMMPVMDGIELCKKLKNRLTTSHIPVILLTAKGADMHQMQGFESGADAYVTKPFNLNLLKQRVISLVESREMLKKRFSEHGNIDLKIEEISATDKKLLEKLNKYVDTNIQKTDLSIEMIADQIGLSRGHLHKKLKALTGASPSEFVRNLRLKKSLELISENKYTVEEISFMVGFSTPSYFSRSFTKLYGTSPTKYKSQLTNKKMINRP